MVENFSILLPDKLAGSACPGMWSPLRDDLQALAQRGITAVVSLTEGGLPAAALAEAGMMYLHLPIRDFHAPDMEQMRAFARFVDEHAAAHTKGIVLAHCRAGIGRTGTMLAAYLIHTGKSADAAIAAVRRARPGSIETLTQIEALHEFQRDVARRARRKSGTTRKPQ